MRPRRASTSRSTSSAPRSASCAASCSRRSGYDLRVWGRFANQAEELGIAAHHARARGRGLRGTFFVEVARRAPLRRRRAARGLPAPCARAATTCSSTRIRSSSARDYRIRGRERAAADDIADYDVDGRRSSCARASTSSADCGVPQGDVLALSAPATSAPNNETWEAMARAGLHASAATTTPAIFAQELQDALVTRAAPACSTPATASGSCRSPTSAMAAADFRHLQITAVSLAEMKDYLLRGAARSASARSRSSRTRSSSATSIDLEQTPGRVEARSTSSRLRGLCRFLRAARRPSSRSRPSASWRRAWRARRPRVAQPATAPPTARASPAPAYGRSARAGCASASSIGRFTWSAH